MSISSISLWAAALSAIVIAIDLRKHPQSMKIMNEVWILTALWASVFGLIAYYWFGREKGMKQMEGMEMPKLPKWQGITLSTLHCGAGCTVADILGSIFLYIVPIAIAGSTMVGGWMFNYILALVIGIYFQYSAIREMSTLSTSTIIKQAVKAEILSLTAWQVGMYGWFYLLIYPLHAIAPHSALNADFWFAMQQAMLAGFVLSLPMNYLLIRLGIKQAM